MVDCIVVGGGLIGMLSALHLSEAGAEVRLVERGVVGREASWAGGGILSPLYPWRCPRALTVLAQWSQAYYPGLATTLRDRTGVDPEWLQSGLLIIGCSEQQAARSWARKNRYRLEILDAETLHRFEPSLGNTSDCALKLPEIAQIRNPRFMKALKLCLEQNGVHIDEHAAIENIVTRAGRVTGVMTSRETISADKVIVASGAWSAKLLRKFHIELDVVPVRGQMLLFKARPALIKSILLSDDYYLIPRSDGYIIVGSTVEYAGYRKATTDIAYQSLQHHAFQLVPALADFTIEQHWAGLRPGSSTGVPYVSAVPGVAGLYVNTGHFRNGIGIGPASARLLTDIVMQRSPAFDPTPYALTCARSSKASEA